MPASSVTIHETLATRPTSTGRLVGIWRLMERIHAGKWTELYSAQPADAAGSPRCDYVVKMMAARLLTGKEPALEVQAQQQLRAQVLAAQHARDTHLVPVLDHCLDGASPYLVMPALPAKAFSNGCTIPHGSPFRWACGGYVNAHRVWRLYTVLVGFMVILSLKM